MRQILTILWDSYRMLSAKKLFWVALGLSILLAMIYASISIEPEEVSFLFGLKSIEFGEFSSSMMPPRTIFIYGSLLRFLSPSGWGGWRLR